MREKVVRTVKWILFAALTAALVRPAVQEKFAADAASVSQVQENIAGLQNEIEGLNQQIEGMEEQQDILEEEMADLNAEIINTMTSIDMKADEIEVKKKEIADKQADINDTSAAYEEAKAQETRQYEDTVKRLRKMYENGDAGYMDQLMGGNGLGDLLNRMDFVEKVYEFDRMMLDEYKATKDQVLELWNQLEIDKMDLENAEAELETDKANLEASKANLDSLLNKKKQQSANYDAEIKKARQEANMAKVKLQQEQQELRRLQASQGNKGGGSNAANGSYSSDYNFIIDNASGSELGKQVARYACQFIGNPYVYGGTSLTNGADCSGFTYRVYKDFNYNLPRTSYEQQNAGTGVSYDEAEPGDLICYSGHVGIYIGGGKIVHASTERTGIKVSNAGYRAIVAVRRIV